MIKVFIFMLIFNKKNITKSLILTSLSLLFTLTACLSNQGNVIRSEDIGAQNSVNEQELTEQEREFLNQNRHRINIDEGAFPSDITYDNEHVPAHCREIDKSVISDEEGDDRLSIYIGGVLGEERNIIISCGLERFQNKLQDSVAVNDLNSRIEDLMALINISNEGGEIMEFYRSHRDSIQVSLQDRDDTTPLVVRNVFNYLKINVGEDDNYIISIDSRLEESDQAHLLAHALSIIEIERDRENVAFIEERTGLHFSTIQKIYYSSNNTSTLTLHFGSNHDENSVAKQTIETFYFYSRFHAYLVNKDLREADLALNHDLSDEAIRDEIITDLRGKNLETDHLEDLYLYRVRREQNFGGFIDGIIPTGS